MRAILTTRILALAAFLALFLAYRASAQLVDDGQTNTLSGVTNFVDSSLVIGSNGPNTLLVITDGSVVNNCCNSTIGDAFSATNSRVVVSGSNSVWNGDTILFLGNHAGGNQLTVSRGATVTKNLIFIGYGEYGNAVQGNGNTAVVMDPDSSLTILDSLYVGYSGPVNHLLISYGAAVSDKYGTIGAHSGTNTGVVTGAGSLWSNATLIIGEVGNLNQLLVSDGAVVISQVGTIGCFGSSNGAAVTGSGSLWSNQTDLIVGRFSQASGNSLLVADGGTVITGNVTIGFFSLFYGPPYYSLSNVVTVSGGTLIVTNAAGTGTLQILGGTNLFNGGLIQADHLVVTNGEGFFVFNEGTFSLGASLVSNSRPFTVGDGSSAATLKLVRSGTNTFADGLVIASNAVLTGNGTINGNVSLSPGAAMSLEIGGVTPGSGYQQINVTGAVQFGGSLSLSPVNGFTPAPSDSFTLMTFGSASGAFANATNGSSVVLTADRRHQFTVTYSSTNLVASNYQPSLFVPSVTPAPGQVTVNFQSIPTNQYEIQYSGTLTNWTVATNAVADFVTNTPGITTWIDKGTNTSGLPLPPARFYRVRQF